MVTTAFSDKIVKATELRKKQSYWLSKASHEPITVVYGTHNLAVINRDRMSDLLATMRYLELSIKFCRESFEGAEGSAAFPWLEQLGSGERKAFRQELMAEIDRALAKDDWSAVGDLIGDWRATAEAKGNAGLMKTVRTKQPKEKYIPLADE